MYDRGEGEGLMDVDITLEMILAALRPTPSAMPARGGRRGLAGTTRGAVGCVFGEGGRSIAIIVNIIVIIAIINATVTIFIIIIIKGSSTFTLAFQSLFRACDTPLVNPNAPSLRKETRGCKSCTR